MGLIRASTSLWASLAAWSMGCASPTDPPREAERPQAAVATTGANPSTLVVSNRSKVVVVLPDLRPGTHTLTDLPPDAAVSRIVAGDEQLVIETIQGVQQGQTLWREDAPVGTDVPVLSGAPLQGDLPTARAEISGWRGSPTLVELQYLNTTPQAETVSLAVQGVRGASWIGQESRSALDTVEVAPGATATVVDALDPAFHDGFYTYTTRVQRGTRQGGSAERRVRHAVPAPGERATVTQTSADLPRTFERVYWNPRARRLHLNWSGVTCQGVGYVLLRTTWSLRPSETSRSIVWTVVSPASDEVPLPPLPPDLDQEVLQAMGDPSFHLSISVEALAVAASYARAAGLEGRMTPADVGDDACEVAYAISLR